MSYLEQTTRRRVLEVLASGLSGPMHSITRNLAHRGRYEEALTYLLGVLDAYEDAGLPADVARIRSVRERIKVLTRPPYVV